MSYYTVIIMGIAHSSTQGSITGDYDVCAGTDVCTGGVVWVDSCNEPGSFGDSVDLPIEENPGVVYPWIVGPIKVHAVKTVRSIFVRWLFRSRATMI